MEKLFACATACAIASVDALVAQLVEHLICNQGVACSNHVGGTTDFAQPVERSWLILSLKIWHAFLPAIYGFANRNRPSGYLRQFGRIGSQRICRLARAPVIVRINSLEHCAVDAAVNNWNQTPEFFA